MFLIRDNKTSSNLDSYRRGVVLGFTVAEIMLLVLFALLLAFVGALSRGKYEIEKAEAINQRFLTAVKLIDDSGKFKKEIESTLLEKVDYDKKLKELEKKFNNQSLPDDVYAELQSQNIDLKSKEGKERFLDILITALAAQKDFKGSAGMSEKDVIATCKAGAELKKAYPDKKINDITQLIKGAQSQADLTKNAKAQAEHWRSEANKCGLGGNLPPCYKQSSGDATPYIFDARIKPEGIVLIDTIPQEYRTRFSSDFKDPPVLNKPLSSEEFRNQTYQFLDWGRKNECRFYVQVYDDLPNDKERFKSMLKTIETSFYKFQKW